MRTHSRIALGPRLLEHGYIQIPLSFIYADLPDGAKTLLAYLLHLKYQRRSYPGGATAALSLRCSTKSISRWLTILKHAQIVTESQLGPSQWAITLRHPSKLPPGDNPDDIL